MTKNFFTFLLFPFFFIAVAFIAGCSAPIGGLLVDNNGTAPNYIKAVPSRFLYEFGEDFIPEDEVKVVGIFDGVDKTINIKDVTIKIKNIPLGKEVLLTESDYKDGFPLKSNNIGMNTVTISYKGLETDYSIQVKDENGGGGPSGPGGPSITIDWIWNRPK